MYAIVETGGKQYKVTEGDVISVEKLDSPVGSSVELPDVRLYSENDTTLTDKKKLEKVKVQGTVLAQKRGDKVRVFKMKRRKGYRRKKGHRQDLTEILITKIEVP